MAAFERLSARAATTRDFPFFSIKSKSRLSSSGDQARFCFLKAASSKCPSAKKSKEQTRFRAEASGRNCEINRDGFLIVQCDSERGAKVSILHALSRVRSGQTCSEWPVIFETAGQPLSRGSLRRLDEGKQPSLSHDEPAMHSPTRDHANHLWGGSRQTDELVKSTGVVRDSSDSPRVARFARRNGAFAPEH